MTRPPAKSDLARKLRRKMPPAEARPCIEVDGAQHHFDEARAYDEKRDAYLKAHGIETLRIPAIQVMEAPDSAALYLADKIRLRLTA